jgi:putative oxidoreductase
MTIVFLFARVFLGALLMYQGVKLLDAYARQVSIANLRGAGVKGSYLAFISAGLMMLIGGVCLVTGVAAGVGVTTAITFLILSAVAMHRFWRVHDLRERRTSAVHFARNIVFADGAALLLLVERPWPYSFIN